MIKETKTKSQRSHLKFHRILSMSISLIIGIILLSLKFWAYNLTHSQAVFSDAAESIVNVIVAAFGLFIISYALKPADKEHPYGHGKAEYFSSSFEGGLIIFSGLFIIIEAIRQYVKGYTIEKIDFGLSIVLFAGLVNLFLGLFLIHMGKKNKSIVLKAGGYHVLSDFWTSLGVFLGLVLYYLTGFIWLDALIALIVGTYLIMTGIHLMKESIAGLMDEQDTNTLEELAKIFSEKLVDGMIQFHHVKVIRSGLHHHIDAHVVVPEFWTVSQSHEIIDQFEKSVFENYNYEGEMNFHLDPCRRAYCKVCPLEDCRIRREKFQKRRPLTLDEIRSWNEPDYFYS